MENGVYDPRPRDHSCVNCPLVAASPTRDHEYIVIVALTAFSGRVLLVVSPNEDGK